MRRHKKPFLYIILSFCLLSGGVTVRLMRIELNYVICVRVWLRSSAVSALMNGCHASSAVNYSHNSTAAAAEMKNSNVDDYWDFRWFTFVSNCVQWQLFIVLQKHRKSKVATQIYSLCYAKNVGSALIYRWYRYNMKDFRYGVENEARLKVFRQQS